MMQIIRLQVFMPNARVRTWRLDDLCHTYIIYSKMSYFYCRISGYMKETLHNDVEDECR